MDLNTRFLTLYNQLDNLLKDKYHIFSNSISSIKRYEDELKKSSHKGQRERGFAIESIRNIRNTLVHEAKIYSYDAFYISQEVIDFLETEINHLLNPKKVFDIAKKREEIYAIKCDFLVKDVMKYMSKNMISHAPILDNEDKVIGIFSESTLYSVLLYNPQINISESLIINDILEYTYLNNHISERFKFVSKNTILSELEEDFEKKVKHEKRLVMILITDNGKKDEPLKGLLTATDLLF